MNLKKVPESDKLLDIALRRARKEAGSVGKQKNAAKHNKAMEIRRVEVAANYVVKILEGVVAEFPNLDEINPFYRELIVSMSNVDNTKKAIAQMQAVAKIVKRLKSGHLVKIKSLGRSSASKAKDFSKQFVGRLSSVVKSLNSSIKAYNKTAERLRAMPHIKTNLATIIIAGHPNVGKSTLLGKITESKPKVAAYPFTTKKLELGYFTQGYLKFQVIDTPGLLDRPPSQRNAIEARGTAALKYLASVIVFILDPTENCGFPIEKQVHLFKTISKEFGKEKVVVYLSKVDIASAAQVAAAGKELGRNFEAIGGEMQEIREELAKLAKSAKFPLN